jgi:hypothetical protein
MDVPIKGTLVLIGINNTIEFNTKEISTKLHLYRKWKCDSYLIWEQMQKLNCFFGTEHY